MTRHLAVVDLPWQRLADLAVRARDRVFPRGFKKGQEVDPAWPPAVSHSGACSVRGMCVKSCRRCSRPAGRVHFRVVLVLCGSAVRRTPMHGPEANRFSAGLRACTAELAKTIGGDPYRPVPTCPGWT